MQWWGGVVIVWCAGVDCGVVKVSYGGVVYNGGMVIIWCEDLPTASGSPGTQM